MDPTRLLTDAVQAHRFLVETLDKPNNKDTGDLAMMVMQAEILLAAMRNRITLKNEEIRHPDCRADKDRRNLRKTIFRELIKLKRLENDDKICFGKGGAKPLAGGPKADKQAFILTGLPGSGKSGIANQIADRYGAYIVDPDYAKRKFPEFPYDFGASLVHEESSLVALGNEEEMYKEEPCLYQYCCIKNYNMVIPRVGYKREILEKFRDNLIDRFGYEVHLTHIELGRKEATIRTLNRFIETKRYVSLTMVFDKYNNDPFIAYSKTKNCSRWASIGWISSDVPKGVMPIFKECTSGNPAEIFKGI